METNQGNFLKNQKLKTKLNFLNKIFFHLMLPKKILFNAKIIIIKTAILRHAYEKEILLSDKHVQKTFLDTQNRD